MDFAFRDDEQQAADLARGILGDHATNERLKALAARGESWDAGCWRALAKAGLLGTAIPEDFDGSDLGFLALCLVLREVGRAVAPVPAFASLVLGALPVARFGSEEQRRALLPGVVAGERILTAALAEAGSNDPLAPVTRADLRDGHVRLTGINIAVPYAEQASHVLVPARGDDGTIALYLVDPRGEGVWLTPQSTSDGQPHAQVEFTGARVPAEARLGAPADDALRWLVHRAIAARCMMQLGVTERALEMTAEYSRTRIQFDRPLGSLQAYHQRAADAYIAVEAVRLSAFEAAWRLSRDLPADEHVAVAKFWAAEGGQSASFACQHLHGGIGIDVDYPLHRHFLWAIQLEHELGSAKHHLDALGRTIAAGGLPPG
jgi:alkylation response protein AidB-like acyl-CoA dehydrogenase